MSVSYQTELCELLHFVASTAVRIRMYSAYGRGGAAEQQNDQYDLLWLSDCLHNFDSLARAIMSYDAQNVVNACEYQLAIYARYRVDTTHFNSGAAFERLEKKGFRLDEAIKISQAILGKATCVLEQQDYDRAGHELNQQNWRELCGLRENCLKS